MTWFLFLEITNSSCSFDLLLPVAGKAWVAWHCLSFKITGPTQTRIRWPREILLSGLASKGYFFPAILVIRVENKLSLRLLHTDGAKRPRSSLSQLWSCLKPEKKVKALVALNYITIPWWNSFFLFSCWFSQNFYIFPRPSSNQTLSSEYLAHPAQSLCQWLAQANGKNNSWLIWMDLNFFIE